MILKSPYFWISTVIFLSVTLVSLTKVVPPAIADFTASRASIKELDAKIADEKRFAASVNELGKNEDQLATVYNLAQEALPDKPDGEELLLQLDGLFSSLDMPAVTASVPLGSNPATANGNQLSVTVTGNYGYAKARDLIAGLRTLIRWNKITIFDISQSANTAHLSLTFNTFYKPGQLKTFSGTSNLLEQAKDLFDNFQSYTTRPNVGSEGNYGRTDPFAAP